MKRALFIAYYFPPIGGSGTQRPSKFVKYLPEFGWQPYVISTDRPYGDGTEGCDETLLADIPPDVRVWRVPTPEPRPVYRLAKWFGWRSTAVEAYRRGIVPPPATTSPTVTQPLTLLARLRHALLAPLYLIHNPPVDPALYWALRIAPLARRIIAQEQIDVVFTTVPPWSALITGALLRGLTGRLWVADFRDPWTDNTFVYFPSMLRRAIDQHLERACLERADAVLSINDSEIEVLRRKTRYQDKPFVAIPNGWDRRDFPHLTQVRAGLPPLVLTDGRIVLLHPGSAYQGEPLPLLWGLDRLAAAGDVDLDRLLFHFIGAVHPYDRQTIERSAHSHRFRFDSHRVPHEQALHLMQEAHILLLLLLRKGPNITSGKIFEYMVAGRPVLASGARNGVAGRLVRECGIGCVVEPADTEGMAQVLRSLIRDYAHFASEVYRPNWAEIDRYERRRLTEELAHTLDRVADR